MSHASKEIENKKNLHNIFKLYGKGFIDKLRLKEEREKAGKRYMYIVLVRQIFAAAISRDVGEIE